ncbi:hypothetical protein FRC08_016458 [Ceratobasidium sp. 394]|nr:hypothetical protein FRC08_016458 [Ceratobasidium sp. 394]
MEDITPAAQRLSGSDTVPTVLDTITSGLGDPSDILSSNIPSQTADLPLRAESRPPRRILLMGLTGAGKSTFINRIAGSDLAVSTGLASCTQQVTSVPLELKDGTSIELVDTPGFNDSLRSDIEILEEIATTLKSWDEEDPNIYGIIYIHRISDVRMSGSSCKSFSVFLNICGEEAMSHVSIVTSMWDTVSSEQGQAREVELLQNPLFFKRAIDSKAQIFRNDNPPDSALEILYKAIQPSPKRLLIQKELSDDKKDLLQTTAGIELDREMAETRAQHEAVLLKIDQEYIRAQQEQDDETLAELEAERENIRQKVDGIQALVDRLLERKAASGSPQEEYAMDHRHERVLWAGGPNTAPEQLDLLSEIKGYFIACLPKVMKRGWFRRGKSRSLGEMAEDASDIKKLVPGSSHQASLPNFAAFSLPLA